MHVIIEYLALDFSLSSELDKEKRVAAEAFPLYCDNSRASFFLQRRICIGKS